MNFKRALAVSRRVFMDLKNDKRTLALIIIAPLFAMAIFGLAFSGQISDVKVIVVNDDMGMNTTIGQVYLSEVVISNLDPDTLSITTMDDLPSAISEIESGNAYAVFYFPANFTNITILAYNQMTEASTSVGIHIDMSNVNVADTIMQTFNDAVQKTMQERGLEMPVSIQKEAVYGANASFMDFFVPGIMAFVVYILTTLLTLINFVGERTSGTLARLTATPLRESEIVAGYAMTFSVVGTLQALLLLTVGMLVFGVNVEGNVALAFMVVALLAIVCQALGILLSSITHREAQAIQLIPFIIMPGFLLSGVFWPLEALPTWLRPFSYLVPPSYAIDACRSVMLRGWGLDMIWIDVVALIVFAAVFLFLATLSLKRRG
ncbi:MAG: ABC transporter permease [Candidatus Thermoplasmatota archaeon]|nr:ABC transporter permease [Euryarchaeota archaeon]MBU4031354.1 ABC transporter permease [Candidatus Thermoplasmatota archaeon]MBU4070835.1 ABC transporter permease [Candidatus Thermoplasmatota archaeon]MBU4143518.1 ABC transporter permease [Candidatus Thermoplasmatota archaeon]MBU4591970.1 ABC transporter permease [Candidatus Thermoplasmatota archaeon]